MDFLILGQRLGCGALALALFAIPPAAAAQDIPSYAQPVSVGTDETIHGRIVSVDGAFNITVADDRGFIDAVVLHQGTIINPTGLSLNAGMSVSILGYNAGSTFAANEIDTPYSYAGPLPTPVYYGPGYWCPGFAYGYGPSFSLAIIIGDGFGRFEHRPFYGRPWDGHRYFGDYVGRDDRHGDNGSGANAAARIDGGPRRLLESGGTRRAYPGENTAPGHVPAAFAGRSFAGRAYNGAPNGTAGARTYAPGERSMTAPAARFGGAQRHTTTTFGAGGFGAATGVYRGGQNRAGGYGAGVPRATVIGAPGAGGFAGGRGMTGGAMVQGGGAPMSHPGGAIMSHPGGATMSHAGGASMSRAGGGAIRH